MMEFVYKCSECGREYPIEPETMLCSDCREKQQDNRPLRGILEVDMKGSLLEDCSIYDVLPVEKSYFPDLPIGDTPVWKPYNLRKELGIPNLFIKDDTVNPTGSYKDRASWLVAAFARKWGINDITVASTGNAASSMAGVGAAAGLNVTIFVPENVPKAKLIQSLQYGAKVLLVKGSYDNAFQLSMQYKGAGRSINRNTGFNPLTIEGKKTVAFELYHQLKGVPDYIFVPTGDAVVLGGVIKGFKDLEKLGWIKTMPTFIAVQAEHSDALTRAFEKGDFENPVEADTIADSISVDVPANGYYALRELKEAGGNCIRVSDSEILEAQKKLSSSTGLFVEPSSAASLAGLMKMKQNIPEKATSVIMATGNGMKDIDAAGKGVEIPNKAIEKLEDIND
jgi:threonine synthase